jgi:sn-glycerol 3-phosphate transport system permease protein
MATTDVVRPTGPTLGAGGPEIADVGTPARIRRLKTTGWYALLIGLSVLVLFPIYVTIVRAISNPVRYVDAGSPLYPVHVEWDAFTRAWSQGDFSRAVVVSFLQTLGITIGQVVTATLAAYAFAFLRFPFKRVVFGLCIATLMLPIEVTLIANLETVRRIHWIDTYQGLVAPFLASALGIFLLRQGFLGIPNDLKDAATLDGYGHFRFLTRVVVPLARPVIASFTVISFLAAWNQYLWPQASTETDRWHTIQISLAQLRSSTPQDSNLALAGAIVASVPIVLLLIFFSGQIIRGLTAGAVKG